jgi:hypothetical protein
MSGELWTKEEIETLKEEHEKGFDVETIASNHQRTQRAIELKLLSLGYDL